MTRIDRLLKRYLIIQRLCWPLSSSGISRLPIFRIATSFCSYVQ